MLLKPLVKSTQQAIAKDSKVISTVSCVPMAHDQFQFAMLENRPKKQPCVMQSAFLY